MPAAAVAEPVLVAYACGREVGGLAVGNAMKHVHLSSVA